MKRYSGGHFAPNRRRITPNAGIFVFFSQFSKHPFPFGKMTGWRYRLRPRRPVRIRNPDRVNSGALGRGSVRPELAHRIATETHQTQPLDPAHQTQPNDQLVKNRIRSISSRSIANRSLTNTVANNNTTNRNRYLMVRWRSGSTTQNGSRLSSVHSDYVV